MYHINFAHFQSNTASENLVTSLVISIALGLFMATPAGAEIYKCVDTAGRAQFSDKPCSKNAEKIEVDTSSSGISHGPQGDFSRVRSDMQRRDIERRITRLESDITGLQDAKNAELSRLRYRQSRANNNLAGATWEQSIATEMASVTQDYNSQIEMKREEISDLRDHLRELTSR